MNDFADELRELIDKWREHPGTDIESIAEELRRVAEELDPYNHLDD